MKLKILFDTHYELGIDICENDFTTRWITLLQSELGKSDILQTDTYSSLMPEEVARNHLLSAISIVNSFLKKDFIQKPEGQDFESIDYYNYLHMQFEKLAGTDWEKPTRLVQVAPNFVKEAIRHINRFCHRLENRPYKIESYMRVEFDHPTRSALYKEDYDTFEIIDDDGVMILDYATLGKTLFECFRDNLPPTYAGMKHQHHYCSNFVLKFVNDIDKNKIQEFKNWIKLHKLSDLPKSVLGEIKLGTFDPNAIEEIKKTSKILKIIVD